MALLWIDGFEMYGPVGANCSPSGIIARRYADAQNLYIADGRFGGKSGRTTRNINFCTPALTSDPTLIVGCAYRFNQYNGQKIIYLKGSAAGVNLRMDNAGQLVIFKYNSLLDKSGVCLHPDTWYYIELKVVTGEAGSYELRLHGQTILTGTADTRPGGSETYHSAIFTETPLNVYGYYDDLYILDGAPGLNDFLGDVKVVAAYPSADTAVHDYQRQPDESNPHYEYVNEPTCNDDMDYVESGIAGHTDLFEHDAVSGLATVHGVQLNVDCRNDDPNDHNIIQVAKLNATQSDGPSQSIGSESYVTKMRVMETDPEGNAWNLSDLNATQFGFKVG